MLKNFYPSIKKFKKIKIGDVLVDPVKDSKVMLIGNFGNGNLGDEILLFCASQDIRRKGCRLVVAVRDEKLLVKENEWIIAVMPLSILGIKSFLSSEHIIIGPGGIFGGDIGPYASVLPFFVLLSKIFGKKVYYYGIGIYETTPLYIQYLVKFSCKFVDHVSVRDEHSFDLLRKGSLKALNTVLILDPAFYIFEYVKKPYSVKKRTKKTINVGISLRYEEDPKEKLNITKKVLLQLDKKDRNVKVFPLNFYEQPTGLSIKHSHPSDKVMLSVVRDKLVRKNMFEVDVKAEAHSISSILQTYSQLDFVIAMRFHAQILAMIFNLPLFSIGYSPKNQFVSQYRNNF